MDTLKMGESTEATAQSEVFEEGEKNWVLLLRRQTDGRIHYEQKGPFSTRSALEMIRAGETSYNDHAWKPGFKRWVRIGDIEEFSEVSPAQTMSFSAPVREAATYNDENLLDNVLRENTNSLDFSEEEKQVAKNAAPEDAGTGDLTTAPKPYFNMNEASFEESPSPAPVSTVVGAAGPVPVNISAVPLSEITITSRTDWAFHRIGMAMIIGGVGLLCVATWWHISHRALGEDMADVGDESEAVIEVQDPAPVKMKAKSTVAEAQKVLQGEIGKMNITSVRTSKGGAVKVESNLPNGSPVHFTVRSKDGQTLSRRDVSESVSIPVLDGGNARLDLSIFKIPAGYYTIQAEAGTLKSSVSMFFGGDEKGFDAKLKTFRAKAATDAKKEQGIIQKTASGLKERAADLEFQFKRLGSKRTQWSQFYSSWKGQLNRADFANVGKMSLAEDRRHYPETLSKLSRLKSQLQERGSLLDARVKAGRGSATIVKSNLENEFRRIQTRRLD